MQARRVAVALAVLSVSTTATACGGTGKPTVSTFVATAPSASVSASTGASSSSTVTDTPRPGGTARTRVLRGETAGAVTPAETAFPSTGVAPASMALAAPGMSRDAQVQRVFERFLYVMSGLDAHLNRQWIPPLAEVTTQRMAQAVVRQARALMDADEHIVGMVTGTRMRITFTSATSAVLADCEDYQHAYVVSASGTPDPVVARGYFVGTAQLVKTNARWYVDTYATTHVSCG